jgi:IS5 family transposase
MSPWLTKGGTLRSDTLVDATIIDAPSSTKSQANARNPKMSLTKKGSDCYFGMEDHVDVDSDTVHSLEATTAKVHDRRAWGELLHGEEKSVWADKGYISTKRDAAFNRYGQVWGIMRKAPKGGKFDPVDEEVNRLTTKVRPKVEHPFCVIKRRFGHMKTRYRGLAKNWADLLTLCALGYLFLVQRRLLV